MSSGNDKNVNESKGALSSFFSNPLVGVFGSIASIAGIFLAIYFYNAGREVPELTYFINPVKAVMVRAGKASRLSTIFDNKVITSDITVAQVALWNQGKKAIKSVNILKPVVIHTDNNLPILEATIRKKSRDVVKVDLNQDEISQGKVIVSWNIFEQDDGAVIQLIYAGDPGVKLKIDGVIEGQAHIRQLEYSGKIRSAEEQYIDEKNEIYYLGIICLLFGAIIIILLVIIKKRLYKKELLWDSFEEIKNKKDKLSNEQIEELRGSMIKLESRCNLKDRFLINMSSPFILWFLMINSCFLLFMGVLFLFYLKEKGPPFGF